jgi:3-polyprenyl-4-hydroxybenzoate decarboxylase
MVSLRGALEIVQPCTFETVSSISAQRKGNITARTWGSHSKENKLKLKHKTKTPYILFPGVSICRFN